MTTAKQDPPGVALIELDRCRRGVARWSAWDRTF
ncbi:hypothetical protein SAMN05444695_11185 [Rhodococcus triatomae]|uniref:Uncharacterized protein n=1 Tax=Rhodococcus triatomae TaxID=300028 RepID=A0A1G8NJ76_9NOCA|nr:hypothetical protein SAMN05444695_11185 [Rhodococcus triatomae]